MIGAPLFPGLNMLNSLASSSSGLTPSNCVLGFQPPFLSFDSEPSNVLAVDKWKNRSQQTWEEAHIRLQRAVRHMKTQTDQRRSATPQFQVGQRVWVSTRGLKLKLPSKKLNPRFIGPFKILQQIPPVSYRLELPSQYHIAPTFHVSLSKSISSSPDPGSVTEQLLCTFMSGLQ